MMMDSAGTERTSSCLARVLRNEPSVASPVKIDTSASHSAATASSSALIRAIFRSSKGSLTIRSTSGNSVNTSERDSLLRTYSCSVLLARTKAFLGSSVSSALSPKNEPSFSVKKAGSSSEVSTSAWPRTMKYISWPVSPFSITTNFRRIVRTSSFFARACKKPLSLARPLNSGTSLSHFLRRLSSSSRTWFTSCSLSCRSANSRRSSSALRRISSSSSGDSCFSGTASGSSPKCAFAQYEQKSANSTWPPSSAIFSNSISASSFASFSPTIRQPLVNSFAVSRRSPSASINSNLCHKLLKYTRHSNSLGNSRRWIYWSPLLSAA